MRIKIWIALLALGLLAGCSNDGAEQASTGVPVIIDSDLAAEGFMSIFYLIAQEDLDVQAIIVSGTGLVHCEAGVNQVLGILDWYRWGNRWRPGGRRRRRQYSRRRLGA